jgi:hypothetical protein
MDADWIETEAVEVRQTYTSLSSSSNLPGLSELPASLDLDARQLESSSPSMLGEFVRMQEPLWSPPSNTSSPTGLDDSTLDEEPPTFEDSHLDPLAIASTRFDFPDPTCSKASPTSSNEAISGNILCDDWNVRNIWNRNGSLTKGSDSPPGSTSEEDVYDDRIEPVNATVKHIPVEQSTLNEIDL